MNIDPDAAALVCLSLVSPKLTKPSLTPRTVTDDLNEARARAARATAAKAELQTAKLAGDLLPASDVEAEWSSILRGVRAAMLSLPSRLGQRLGHLSPADIANIDAEIRIVLEETARN